MRVSVRPALLRWARERSGLPSSAIARRFPRLQAWERGDAEPTLKQLEDFARATHAPFGYLLLTEPPVETIPIPDFRTVGSSGIGHPSPDLLDTTYICEQRQEWYSNYQRITGEDPLPFVGSLTRDDDVVTSAAIMRDALRFDIEHRSALPTWDEALREFVAQADALGILVMCSGIVGSNTHRKLDPQEFRGFAMVDGRAPLVFINGADSRSAQMFTLAHELAHVWLGQSALSDVEARTVPTNAVERWCNRVAAELLVPLILVREEFRPTVSLSDEVPRLARRFKVSTLVVLRRIHDAGGIDRDKFRRFYEAELERLSARPAGSGGDFYRTLPARVSKRFARALLSSTLEGRTLYREAMQLMGFSKMKTFDELARSLGVMA